MNEVLNAIRNRRVIRKFKPDPIDSDQVQAILEAGRWAPSFSNLQPWSFIVIQGKELKNEVAEAAKETVFPLGIQGAPVVIVVCVDCKVDSKHAVEAGAAATQNMALAAYSLSLGTGWIGVWGTTSETAIRKRLRLPEKMRVVSLVPVGIPDESPGGFRKPLDTFVHFP